MADDPKVLRKFVCDSSDDESDNASRPMPASGVPPHIQKFAHENNLEFRATLAQGDCQPDGLLLAHGRPATQLQMVREEMAHELLFLLFVVWLVWHLFKISVLCAGKQ